MRHRTLLLGALGALGFCPFHLAAQSAAASPAFEVASVKPSAPGDEHRVRVQIAPGGRFVATGVTPRFLIQQAFDVKDFQISGGPAWMSSERYDINAKAEGTATPETLRPMLQALLAERFGLKFHKVSKEAPVFALVVGKNGHKLKENTAGVNPAPQDAPPPAPGPGAGGGNGALGVRKGGAMMRMGRGELDAQNVTMQDLATQLSRHVGRNVIDKTGLKGNYDVKLQWTPDEGMMRGPGPEGGPDGAAPPPPDASGPSIFSAVQEQLGLKLESQRGMVDSIVIDSIEKASAN